MNGKQPSLGITNYQTKYQRPTGRHLQSCVGLS